MNALYQQSLQHCHVAQSEIEKLCAKLEPVRQQFAKRAQKGSAPLLNLPSRRDDLASIEALAAQIRGRFKTIVIVGAGGSGLSGRVLLEFRKPAPPPCFHFLENIDPDAMENLLQQIDFASTCFLVISKSGTTVETLSQLYVLIDVVTEKCGKASIAKQFYVITMPGDNPMRRTAAEHGMTILDHAPDIGGRFSILTNVGLLPAAIAGIDIGALREGAQTVIEQMEKNSAANCPSAMGAALQYASIDKGLNLSVMLPYCGRLSGFSDWYRQCWAESLGKNGLGSTPIRAVGTTDQHSQLQLYLDGPQDKLFHMILLKRAGSGRVINAPADPELTYIRSKTLGDIMAAGQKATLETLVDKGCPVRLFTLEKLDEREMGALLMHFTLEILFMAALLEVNPLDQPAVEEGKEQARQYLLSGNL